MSGRPGGVAPGGLVALGLGLGLAACGPWLPSPQPGTHEGDQPVIVPEAPPEPHVEIVPEAPEASPDAVWRDGQWLFQGRRWEWQPGGWEVPPPGAVYAPPAVVYLPDQRIAWFAGRWHVRAPAGRAAPARALPSEVRGAPSSDPRAPR